MAYAMTYNNSVTDIQQYLERTDAETVARIPTFIGLAERVIASQIKFCGQSDCAKQRDECSQSRD